MKILLIGATGTIGREVAAAFRAKGHEVVEASRQKATHGVDLTDPASLRALFKKVGKVDAIVTTAGSGAWKPLAEMTDADFESSLRNKLMGQVNAIRYGFEFLNDGGSVTVTSGVLAQQPMKNAAVISMLNSGLEGFTRGAALEAPRGIRVNCVSPPWVSETLSAMGSDPKNGLPSAEVAKSYLRSIEGRESGQIFSPGK